MQPKEMISSILSLLGGIISIITVLPIFSYLFPLEVIRVSDYNYSLGQFYGGTYAFSHILYFTFWGSNLLQFTPKGWTFLSLPPIVMVLIFITLGLLTILVVLLSSIRSDKIPNTGLTGIVIGTIDLIILDLISLGDIRDLNHFGLSHSSKGIISIGLGYWLLLFSAILIIIGGIVNLMINQRNSKKINKKERLTHLSERTENKLEKLLE